MIEDRISIKFIGKSEDAETIIWPLKELLCVEHLIHDVLDSQGVGPVYNTLFGLKIANRSFWLAPNLPIEDLQDQVKSFEDPKLELRMRFRPSSFRRILASDRETFEIIFAQIKHDFMKTRFNDEKKRLILLNDGVFGLIALDLLRHSIKYKIDINNLLKQVKPVDFIPESAARWQRALVFRLAERINLLETLHIGYRNCGNNLDKIEQSYIELFLSQVALDYGSETYDVFRIGSKEDSNPMEIRVRYQQTEEESQCFIECRLKSKLKLKEPTKWEEICNIENITHGTLRQKTIQIARAQDEPLKFEFLSIWHAQSFISAIDGYYRLMKKWNFNFCREVLSPELTYLKRICSHGPIGSETSRIKLSTSWKSGRFLIRKCMHNRFVFLIDMILRSNARLIIDVEWNPEKRVFRVSDYAINRKIKVSVSTDRVDYSTLKSLVNGTQIWIEDDDQSYPQQLKHWLPPSEMDDYPALLLSISKKKLKEFVSEDRIKENNNCLDQLPRFVPASMLNISTKILSKPGRPITVKLATLNGDTQVVVKCPESDSLTNCGNHLMFHSCINQDEKLRCLLSCKNYQSRITDWIFVKHNLLAETIGLCYIDNCLIQEYFPLGTLDKYLHEHARVSQLVKLSISFQLAEMLLFLQERSIIHGKIRCYNLFVKQAHPVQIKLADPLGPFNIYKDQAFIPPEYSNMKGEICLRHYDSAIDVWAFGTTLWQIYCDGTEPPRGRYANTLTQPFGCPDAVWNVIESCWTLDAKIRASPRTLLRDINDLFAWENGSHEYHYIKDPKAGGSSTIAAAPTATIFDSSSRSLSPNSSITSSTISSNCNGSQSSLLRASASLKFGSSNSSNLETIRSQEPKNNGLTKRLSRASWRNLVNFKNRANDLSISNLRANNLISRAGGLDFGDMAGSRLSLSSCPTPSGSEVTRMTEVLDFQSISDAFDRCVWHVESHRLKLGSEIGRGTSGVVIKGKLSQLDGQDEQVVAVKCLDKNLSDYGLSNIEDLRKEFNILKNLNHENVIKTLGYVEESYMKLIFEYMPLGSLLSYIKNRLDNLHSLPLLKYAQDIANGMEYLESMKIIHRDLALRNILVKSPEEVKICDFGLARFLGSSDHYTLKTERALPLKWYAPETLIEGKFSHESDVWSYGIVLWEIYSGGNNPQYSGTYANLAKTLEHERLPRPKGCPQQMYDLMMKCWSYNPKERISFTMIRRLLEETTDEILKETKDVVTGPTS